MTDHLHNPWLCPTHVGGCECPTLDGWLCNPYWQDEYCPDSINVMPEGEGCPL